MLKWRYRTPEERRRQLLATIMEEKIIHIRDSIVILVALPEIPNTKGEKLPSLSTFQRQTSRKDQILEILDLFENLLIYFN